MTKMKIEQLAQKASLISLFIACAVYYFNSDISYSKDFGVFHVDTMLTPVPLIIIVLCLLDSLGTRILARKMRMQIIKEHLKNLTPVEIGRAHV